MVFNIDLLLPLGVASAVPYTFAVLLALRAKSPHFAIAIALLCGVLTFAKMALVPESGTTEMWKVIVNRCLAIFSISMTLILGFLRRRSVQRRQRSEEILQEHQTTLSHLGRLSLMGQIAANMAHELNQPLTAVCLQAEMAVHLAKVDPLPREQLTQSLQEIVQQSKRAADLIRSVRRLALKQDAHAEFFPIEEVVQTVVALLHWRAERANGLIHTVSPVSKLPTIMGDRIQVEQLVFNLILNAIEALESHRNGNRTIELSMQEDAQD